MLTADRLGAGTDAEVKLTLLGDNGNSGPRTLDGIEFARGRWRRIPRQHACLRTCLHTPDDRQHGNSHAAVSGCWLGSVRTLHMSMHMSIHISMHMPMHMSVHMFVHMST